MPGFKNLVFRLSAYFKYLLSAKHRKGHGIHSPFMYKLVSEIFQKTGNYYSLFPIERQRKKFLQNKTIIEPRDFGAGSSINSHQKKKLSDIAKHSTINKKYGRLLFRLINHFEPQTMLEFGTSLGISSMYMAAPNSKSKIYSLEGCPNISKQAQEAHKNLNFNTIELINGEFSDTLPLVLSKIKQLDLVYFDGNHKKQPTLNYFKQCLRKAHNDSVFIFDDIHWSEDMQDAWKEIKRHPEITQTVDIFRFGIVFFKQELSKENFTVWF